MAANIAGTLWDIQDGKVYQDYCTKEILARGRQIFSLVVSSDGAPMIKSKKYSVWPLMCFLVELPPKERYKFKNILLTGLWYGKQKSNVSLFLKSFVNELHELSNGCDFEDEVGQRIPAICHIQSVVPDLPAKAMLFNVKQYNGLFGCTTCKYPGTYDQALRSGLYEYTGNIQMRTAEESRICAMLAERSHTTLLGFKGENAFKQLVSIPDNLPIDWMHCICEGILKRQLFSRWLDSCYIEEDYSLLGFKEELDDQFLSVKVPHDYTRKPRSITDKKHWKASEYHLFVLFAGLPCLRCAVLSDLFSVNHFYHFALLVTALRHLHSVPVLHENVAAVQVLLDNFVRLLPMLYGRKECTYNSHALLHFPNQVLDNASLSFTSAFVFESFISHLKNMFSGTRGIPKQMVEKLGISQGYRRHVADNCMDNVDTGRFAEHLLKETKPRTRNTDSGVYLHEPIRYLRLHPYARVIQMHFGSTHQPNIEYPVSYRMMKDNVTFHSTMYPRKGKSCSYIVQYQLNQRLAYGKVICYILYNNTAFALILKYNQTGINVCQKLGEPQDAALREIVHKELIGQHFPEIEASVDNNPVIVKCRDIRNRCMYIPSNNDEKGYLTSLDTPYEHD